MLKVYDPEGQPVVRQLIEDGIVSQGYQPAIGGWDQEVVLRRIRCEYRAAETRASPARNEQHGADPNRIEAHEGRGRRTQLPDRAVCWQD
jgi:hypothetical protein